MLGSVVATRRPWTRSTAAAGLLLILIAQTVTIGADTMWLVAMGSATIAQGGIPTGVPFASASSADWVNVPVLGELFFAAIHAVGPAGLPFLQFVVDAALFMIICIGAARAGARDLPAAVVLVVAAFGMLASLGVVRAQLMSLVPLALLLVLLRSEHASPSRRIWLAVPLVIVWGNLHGAVLVGVACIGCYLLFSRLRVQPATTLGVGACTVAGLWITPAHVRTADYYLGVLGNEAARRGTELWASPSLSKPLDVLMLVAAVTLVVIAATKRRPVWEYVAAAGLAVGTAMAARHGVWLILFASAPAASALTGQSRMNRATPSARGLASVTAMTVALAGTALILSRSEAFPGDADVVASVKATAQQSVVLAPEPLAETLAASDVRVWMSNPIDAFSRQDQAAYLDFLAGGGPSVERALRASDVVVVPAGSKQALLADGAGFVVERTVDGYLLMKRP